VDEETVHHGPQLVIIGLPDLVGYGWVWERYSEGATVTSYNIDNNFTYHAPKKGQPERYESLREMARELAYRINQVCPDSREKSFAMTKLEEAVMWANASIARNE
jgi:hypothetical protein